MTNFDIFIYNCTNVNDSLTCKYYVFIATFGTFLYCEFYLFIYSFKYYTRKN